MQAFFVRPRALAHVDTSYLHSVLYTGYLIVLWSFRLGSLHSTLESLLQ